MNIHLTLSAPLPWLAAVAKLLSGKQVKKAGLKGFIFPRTLSFTREGKIFIATLFLIGIAAINTGNNLLYLIVAMMLSFIVISGILSESTLRGVAVLRILPKHIFAGRPAIVKLAVSNNKRFFPSLSLLIEEIPHLDKGRVFSAEPIYIIKLPAGSSVTHIHPCTFQKRGVYKIYGLKVKTRFPFGLFLKGRRLDAPAEVIVYPEIKHVKDIPASRLAETGFSNIMAKGSGAGIYSIRDYTHMDDSRLIHWRSTAKTGRLMAKELEQEGRKRVEIIFHNVVTESTDLPERCSQSGFENKFEEMVEEAASIANHFIMSDFEVGFKSLTSELPCRSGREHLYRILRELALIKPVASNIPLSLT